MILLNYYLIIIILYSTGASRGSTSETQQLNRDKLEKPTDKAL